ncbi:MAG: hypothetical protein ACOVQ2_01330 [Flavobacterium sp.]
MWGFFAGSGRAISPCHDHAKTPKSLGLPAGDRRHFDLFFLMTLLWARSPKYIFTPTNAGTP